MVDNGMRIYSLLCKAYTKISWGQWIRISIVSCIGYYIFEYALKWTFASQSVIKLHTTYALAVLADEINSSSLVNNSALIFSNASMHEPALFFFVAIVAWMALLKWFALPEKIIDINKIKENIRRMENE